MPTREFTDERGVRWTVWTTKPSGFHVLSGAYAEGWLTFESRTGTRRRLAPVPRGWEVLLPAELCELCQSAEPVRTHRGLLGPTPLDLPDVEPDEPPNQSA